MYTDLNSYQLILKNLVSLSLEGEMSAEMHKHAYILGVGPDPENTSV
jgi:hypothetical protein